MRSVIPRWIPGLAAVLTLLAISPAQGQAPQSRKLSVVANDCRFTPARFEVDHYDAVTITFSAEDQPHSFVIDAYRIAKRASSGGSVTSRIPRRAQSARRTCLEQGLFARVAMSWLARALAPFLLLWS